MSDPTSSRRIALFIDFENLVTNTGITASNFDIEPSLDRLLETGKVIFRRAYCDWARFKEAKGHLHEFGVELIDVPPSTRSGKNGADMRLVIDALELSYVREHIDTFVIASGDSDFCPLAYKLRENNKTVVGLGVKQATSPLFVKACDEFIYLRPPQRQDEHRERDRERERERDRDRDRDRERPAPRQDQKPAEQKAAEPKPAQRSGRREVPALAREIIKSLLARATSPTNPSFLKEAIVRKHPDFDERDHGFSSFSRLLEALEKEGVCQRIQQGRQWYVVAREGDAGARATPAQGHESTTQDSAPHDAPPPDDAPLPEEEHIPDPED